MVATSRGQAQVVKSKSATNRENEARWPHAIVFGTAGYRDSPAARPAQLRCCCCSAGMEALALIGDLGLNVVDEAEIVKCRKIFNSYDEDHDGKLTYAELLTCLRVCGGNPSVDEFKELVQVVDTKLVRRAFHTARSTLPSPPTRDTFTFHGRRIRSCKSSSSGSRTWQEGALNFDDFMGLYVMELKDGPNNQQEMLEAFQAFDKASNGFIGVDDMKHVLTSMGTDRLTPEEADIMLKLVDKDGHGVLNYEEIIQVLASDAAPVSR